MDGNQPSDMRFLPGLNLAATEVAPFWPQSLGPRGVVPSEDTLQEGSVGGKTAETAHTLQQAPSKHLL